MLYTLPSQTVLLLEHHRIEQKYLLSKLEITCKNMEKGKAPY